MRLKQLLIAFVLCLVSLTASPVWATFPGEFHEQKEFNFTVPVGLETQVSFWKAIYSKYTTRQVVIHDDEDLSIIYHVVELGDNKSNRYRRREVRKAINKYKTILHKLARLSNFNNLSYEEDRVARLVKKDFYQAARRIRDQLGQADRFEDGIRRAGRYMPEIKRIFKEVGVPVQLSALPHVESSFQVHAYSSAGAAGVWQFTRSTGRRFMSINYEVDERKDPILAAYAAAKLLKYNYESIGSWPLAITAYNHGLRGMTRAKKRHGDDIVKIVRNYKSRTFGFASRNFFAEFLAALEVSSNPNLYFPNHVREKPISYSTVQLRDYVNISTLEKYLGMDREEIAFYNPALRRPVITGKKHVPKHYVLKAPADRYPNLAGLYEDIPEALKHNKQMRSRWYKVQWGDTLISIANRLGTTVSKLKELNVIGHRNRIYRGQVLEIPGWSDEKVKVTEIKTDWNQYDFKVGDTFLYRVKRRDTLTRIAKKHGVHVGVLAKINNLTNPHALRVGQRVKVPKDPNMIEAKLVAKKPETVKEEKLEVTVKQVAVKPQVSTKNETKEGDTVLASTVVQEFNTDRPAFRPMRFIPRMEGEYPIGIAKVDFDETLSHFADWARISIRELRRLNNLRWRSRIHINQTIKVPFRRVTPEEFETKRQEYHKAIQEDFYTTYKVEKVLVRKLKKGDTLWELCNNEYVIPLWLLGYYNPGKDLNSLHIGEDIKIPLIAEIKA
ncbi:MULTISPECIES: LysM peptidoglycan-binding domain-containing protein [unclassified Nitrospina]|uniref:LysM peptidoglycan-binding domain-containing protein n=1 Tax=unclassified Nitrospina TaxID=2638683 RepID=UPI003F9DFB49